VEQSEAAHAQREAAFAVLQAEVLALRGDIARLESFFEDSSQPIEAIAGGYGRLQRVIEELKIWNRLLRFSAASSSSNPGLSDFLARGSVHETASFAKSPSDGGAIGFLRAKSSKFEPYCIVSDSSNNLYNLIDPESNDCCSTNDSGKAWTCFEFREAVDISEIQIQSASGDFPRSFDFVLTGRDGTIVRREIRDANLNGRNQSERYEIGEMSVQSVKIEQKGVSWSGRHILHIHSVQFFSSAGKFKSGVFNSLFREHRNEIRQFVCVTARDFDLSEIHSISSRANAWTWPGDREWLEIDLIDHQLFVTSYRLKRGPKAVLRSWSLLGSNDRSLGLDQWTTIDSRSESRRGEFELLQTFDCFGGPFRYVRIVNEGPMWDGRVRLNVWHLELFGLLLPVKAV
jgi:hypothetical protein